MAFNAPDPRTPELCVQVWRWHLIAPGCLAWCSLLRRVRPIWAPPVYYRALLCNCVTLLVFNILVAAFNAQGLFWNTR